MAIIWRQYLVCWKRLIAFDHIFILRTYRACICHSGSGLEATKAGQGRTREKRKGWWITITTASQTDFATVTDQLASGKFFLSISRFLHLAFLFLASKQAKWTRNGGQGSILRVWTQKKIDQHEEGKHGLFEQVLWESGDYFHSVGCDRNKAVQPSFFFLRFGGRESEKREGTRVEGRRIRTRTKTREDQVYDVK